VNRRIIEVDIEYQQFYAVFLLIWLNQGGDSQPDQNANLFASTHWRRNPF